MSGDLVTRDHEGALSTEQLKYIASTEFVPKSLRGNLPAILACVAMGRAIGVADMTALQKINVIDGKATMSAELMVQLVRRAGHSLSGDAGDGRATAKGRRFDTGDEMAVTWTLQMAERAGLLGKQNWQRYPESMLWARAVSQLCRMLFPDCLGGVSYTPDELADERVGFVPPPDVGPDDGPEVFGEPDYVSEAEAEIIAELEALE